MPTCPSCGATNQVLASACGECGVEVGLEVAVGAGATAATDAPTLLAPDSVVQRLPGPGSEATMIGRDIIGQYVIREKLGEGGMGQVYLADQPAIGRQVAIKVVHAQIRESDHDEHVARFRNEAKAAASLESPHIVQIFNWGELEDGTLFMAMEYLPGETLAQRIRAQGPMRAAAAVDIAEQVCSALSEAHAAGIVHRDLKPSNIMLSERDGATFTKVVDFGVAKVEGSDITRSGAMFGTPQYMSPEQLRAGPIDGRSDLYSLGVLLYEMLTGSLPFSSPTTVGFITAHLHDPPPGMPVEVPSELAEVVMLLLAKDPDERPPDAMAVAAELRAALGGRSPAARRRVRRRAIRRVSMLILGATLVIGVGTAAFLLWEDRQQTQAALDRERAERVVLERRVVEESEAARQARQEAIEAATLAQEATARVRAERGEQATALAQRKPGRKLDAKTKQMLTRSRPELEQRLRQVLDNRRVPPSEIRDVLASYEDRVAVLEAGQISDDELREELVSMIALYRRSFALKRLGDADSLTRLEATFTMLETGDAVTAEVRQELLAAVYSEVDQNPSLDDADKDFFKRLAVAALIRTHGTRQALKALSESESESESESDSDSESLPESLPSPGADADRKANADPEPEPREPSETLEGEEEGELPGIEAASGGADPFSLPPL